MNKYLSIFLFFFSNFCWSQQTSVVIKNVTIVNPAQKPKKNQFVLIENGIITQISNQTILKKNVNYINAKGQFLIPGLIDSHVHISNVHGFSENDTPPSNIITDFKKQLPKSYLYFGYTTLIDLGSPNHQNIIDFKQQNIAPDLYHFSAAVIGNGYGLTNRNIDTPNFVHHENEHYPFPKHLIAENHSVKNVIHRIKKTNAIGVKSYYEPGFDRSGKKMPTPTKEIMKTLVNEAYKNGLLLAIHANSLTAHSFLNNYKVDIVSHGLWSWEPYKLNNNNHIPNTVKTVLNTHIKNKLAYTPTLRVMLGLRALTSTKILQDSLNKKVVPKSLLNWYNENNEVMYQNIFGNTPKSIIDKVFLKIYKQGELSLKHLYNHNGIILFGTDTPAAPTYGNPPGYNGFLEMLAMHKAGVSLENILSSATINNAKTLQLKNIGQVKIGYKANLLLLNKNPLQNIKAYNSIDKVILNGKIISRNTLSVK